MGSVLIPAASASSTFIVEAIISDYIQSLLSCYAHLYFFLPQNWVFYIDEPIFNLTVSTSFLYICGGMDFQVSLCTFLFVNIVFIFDVSHVPD